MFTGNEFKDFADVGGRDVNRCEKFSRTHTGCKYEAGQQLVTARLLML